MNENSAINGAKLTNKPKTRKIVRPAVDSSDLRKSASPDLVRTLFHHSSGATQRLLVPSSANPSEAKTMMQIHAAHSSTPIPILAKTCFIDLKTGFV